MLAPQQTSEPTLGARLVALVRFLALILTISGGLGIAWSAYEAGLVAAGSGGIPQRNATAPVVPLVLAGPTTYALPTATGVATPTAVPMLAQVSGAARATATRPAATATAEPSATVQPTAEVSATAGASATATDLPTATDPPTATPQPTATVRPAATVQPTATAAAQPSPTAQPTALPTAAAEPTFAGEPTATPAPQLVEIAPPQPVDAAVAAMAEAPAASPEATSDTPATATATATPTPTRVRSGNYRGQVHLSVGASADGATAPTGAWGVVQWVDGQGVWHDIDGWTGAVGPEGTNLWVEPKDFGTGPFRWCLYDTQGGALTGISDLFYLPERASEPVQVVMNPAS